MKSLLQEKELRTTAFRLSVLDIFQKNENALDMGQIEADLGEFDRITLYRTIKLFLEKGIIHEIAIVGESKQYALCSSSCNDDHHEHDHIHFLCTACHETFCLEVAQMPKIQHKSFAIHSMEIQTKGICESCQSA